MTPLAHPSLDPSLWVKPRSQTLMKLIAQANVKFGRGVRGMALST